MVVRPAAASRLVSARRQLCDVRRNIQRHHVHLFVLRFRGRQNARPDRNHQQSEQHRSVQAESDRLAPAKLFILRPDVLYLHRLYREGQGRLLWRPEELLDACPKATKIRSPGDSQSAVHWTFRSGPGAKEILEVVAYTRAKRRLSEGRVRALA